MNSSLRKFGISNRWQVRNANRASLRSGARNDGFIDTFLLKDNQREGSTFVRRLRDAPCGRHTPARYLRRQRTKCYYVWLGLAGSTRSAAGDQNNQEPNELSAIFGVVGSASREELDAMTARLAHKGNYSRYWSPAADVWLGEVRHSPRTSDEDELTAFSGQLYLDSREHGATLDTFGPLDRDHMQRALAAAAVRQNPVSFAEGLDGYFGIASWDPGERRLLLTVDRLNYERLYFTGASGRFVFASEYKALLALEDVEAAPDVSAIQYSVATVSPNLGRTFCRGIERVPSGHTLVVKNGARDAKRYFQPQCVAQRGGLERFATGLRQTLVDTVQALLSHHQRIGITLSGGLDSAGLLGIIRHALPDTTVASYTISTGADDPELIGARRAADHFGTEHHEYEFDPASIASDLPKLVWLAEDFASREESVLQYQIESLALEHEPVLTNGRGADIALAGMPRHRLIRMAESLPFSRTAMTEIYQQTQSGAPPRSLLGRLGSHLLYHGTTIEPPRILGAGGPARVYEPVSVADARNRGMSGSGSNQYHAAFASMTSTEVIMPFMSEPFMTYCMRIPTRFTVGFRHQKMVLQQAIAPFVPDEIRRRGKSIQRARRDTALSDAIDSLAAHLLSAGHVAHCGLIAPSYVTRLRQRPADGIYRGDQLTRLWMLVIVELWCRTFVDQRGEPWGFDRNDPGATTPRKL